MLSLLFVIAFISTIVLILTATKWCGIKLLSPSILSVFIWFYLAYAYVGILPLYFYWDEYRYLTGVTDKILILKLWLYSSLAIMFVIIGFIFGKHLLKMNFKYDRDVENSTKKIEKYILLIFIICLLVFYLYISKLPAIPIFRFFSGYSPSEIKVLRSLATNGFAGKEHWYRLFLSGILPLLSFISFSQLIKGFSWFKFIKFLLIFIITTFIAIMNTEKAPIVWFLIGLMIAFMLTKRKSFNLKGILFLCVTAFPILILMYQQFMGLSGRPILDSIQSIMSRAFTGAITPAYFYLEIFPNYHDFLLGTSLPNPRGIFPWDYFNLTVEVMNHVFPELSKSGVVGTMPTVFWGEMYANFGFGGIVVSSLIIGLSLYIIQYFIHYFQNTPITIGLYTWLILEFVKLTESGFSMFMLNINLVVVVMISIFLYIIDVKGQRSRGRIIYGKSSIYSSTKL